MHGIFSQKKTSPARRFSKTIVMRLGLRMRVEKWGLEIVAKFRMLLGHFHGQDSADNNSTKMKPDILDFGG